jgi:putative oxidoreductase
MQDTIENWDPKQIGGWKGFLKQLYRHHKPDGGALILRLIIGAVFILHGLPKLENMSGTVHFFATLGMVPFMAYFVCWLELIGGALIILGFWIKPVCVALAVDMAVVVWGLPAPHGGIFFGHEYEFVLLILLLSLYIGGPGKYSLARLWLNRKPK